MTNPWTSERVLGVWWREVLSSLKSKQVVLWENYILNTLQDLFLRSCWNTEIRVKAYRNNSITRFLFATYTRAWTKKKKTCIAHLRAEKEHYAVHLMKTITRSDCPNVYTNIPQVQRHIWLWSITCTQPAKLNNPGNKRNMLQFPKSIYFQVARFSKIKTTESNSTLKTKSS